MVTRRTKPSARPAPSQASRTTVVQLPKHLDLLGKKWAVTNKKDSKNYGTTYHAKLIINVNPDHAEDQQRDTLLHEIIHALEVEGQLKMSERQVRGSATLILAALRQNPTLVKFLLG